MLLGIDRYLFGAVLIAAGLQSFNVLAAAEEYEFDRSHTRIFFEVDHIGFSQFRGMFHEYAGTFIFDEQDLSKSRVDVTVDMASADMYHEEMNEHLASADLLDIARFPQARFVSKAVKKTGDDTAEILGDLTLQGETHPITLNVRFNKAGINPVNKKFTRGFTATGVLDRTAYGIDYAAPLVSKEVNLTIAVESTRVEQ